MNCSPGPYLGTAKHFWFDTPTYRKRNEINSGVVGSVLLSRPSSGTTGPRESRANGLDRMLSRGRSPLVLVFRKRNDEPPYV